MAKKPMLRLYTYAKAWWAELSIHMDLYSLLDKMIKEYFLGYQQI